MSAPTDLRDAQLTLDDLVRHLAATEDETARQRLLLAHLQHFDHDTLFTRLKDESDRHWQIDHARVLRFADDLLFVAERTGAHYHHAVGLMSRGDALRALGHPREALAALNGAGDAFLALGDEVGWARTRSGWLMASYSLGEGAAALETVRPARAILLQAGLLQRAGLFDLNMGSVCRNLSRYQDAMEHYESARRLFERLGDTATTQVAWAKANMANVLPYLGDFHAAVQLHEEVRQEWVAQGNSLAIARQDHNIAFVYVGLGYYTRALQRYTAASVVLEDARLPYDMAWNYLYTAECYLNLNMLAEARNLARLAVATFEEYGSPTDVARARLCLALAEGRDDHTDLALALLDQAAATFAAVGLVDELAQSYLERSKLHSASLAWPAAHEAARQASALFASHRLVVRQAHADLVQAGAALALGDHLEASELAQQVMAIARERGLLWLVAETHSMHGHIAESQGAWEAALAEYDAAIAAIEHMQSKLAIELRTNILADKRHAYDRAIALSLHLGNPAGAFAYVERARSRALTEYLAHNLGPQIAGGNPADADLLARLTQLRAEHNWFYNELYGWSSGRHGPEQYGQDDEAPLRAALQEREDQIARLVERIALDRTEGLVLSPAHGPERDFSPADLSPGTVLLAYSFRADGNDGANTVFVVSQGRVAAVTLTAHSAQIRRLLKGWELHLSMCARAISAGGGIESYNSGARRILQSLYRVLIAPVEEHLVAADQLIIVPDGAAHGVPFAALHDGAAYLLERFAVTICPSSNLHRLCAERARRGKEGGRGDSALVMAHSDGGRLPFVLEEAQAVAALLPGEIYCEADAKRATLVDAASRHTILHLATHAEARLDNPMFAHLKLADGQLGVIDLANLNLGGALVVLSACETGQSVVTAGDEVLGLTRGFLFAGAATLVQSLWRVDDRATAQLMAHFYTTLLNHAPKGVALQAAQLALLRGEYQHPFFWAPFQLIGDDAPL